MPTHLQSLPSRRSWLVGQQGTERLWSCLIKLIGIERASLVCSPSHCIEFLCRNHLQWQHHIWLLDCQASAIGLDLWKELGPWLKWRMKKGIGEQGDTAQDVLDTCSVPITDLRDQWTAQ